VKNIFVMWKRELAACFLSPSGYITMVLFLVVNGFGFWYTVSMKQAEGLNMYEFLQASMYSAFGWISILIVVPIVTMRLLAEEKKTGTIETLMTCPVSNGDIVLSKFLGAYTFYLLMWIPTLAYFFVANRIGGGAMVHDVGTLASAYVGGAFVGALFVAVGLLCSSLTSNQITAAILSFASLTSLFIAGFLPYYLVNEPGKSISDYFSVVMHMLNFSRGVLDTRPVVFYVSSVILCLFVTVRVVEARQWK